MHIVSMIVAAFTVAGIVAIAYISIKNQHVYNFRISIIEKYQPYVYNRLPSYDAMMVDVFKWNW